MLKHLVQKIIGTKNERELKRLRPRVEATNALESEMQRLRDADFTARTAALRERVEQVARAADETDGDVKTVLDEILPEVFALCREVGRRVLNMRHFDVQLIGGMVLHEGKIAEMATGEGKTLVATLPVYLNALTGKGAHGGCPSARGLLPVRSDGARRRPQDGEPPAVHPPGSLPGGRHLRDQQRV